MWLRCIDWKILLVILHLFSKAGAWDNDDLEVFDVVEEVDQNFYDLLGVSQDASSSEIRGAYRSLTLKLHPDKSDAPDAEVQFRNLVSVYNILKDPGKREKYNEVLKVGLPNWRSAVYYYRHARKMGLVEMSIILLFILTIGQYIVSWASYAEKRYIAEQILGTKRKKSTKKSGIRSGGEYDAAELIAEIPSPSVKNLLPCQIVRLLISTIIFIPYIPHHISRLLAERKRLIQEKKEREEEERLQQLQEEEEYLKEKELRAIRRRRAGGFKPPERSGVEEPGCILDPVDEPEKPLPTKVLVTGGLWTDDDLSELVRLVKKYPGGTSGRWERVAEAMGRNVAEVTHMAAKLKENCYRVPGQEPAEGEIPGLQITKKVKTKGGKVGGGAAVESVWSQAQQKALENALAKHPRSSDRWEKISKCVPDKTKEECMLRYKYLVELVKKQKSDEASDQIQSDDQPKLAEDQTFSDDSPTFPTVSQTSEDNYE